MHERARVVLVWWAWWRERDIQAGGGRELSHRIGWVKKGRQD
jgi:hypothetical protein